MNLKFLLSAVIFMVGYSASAQYFQYSQYNYASQRVNPSIVASTDFASVGLLFRNQTAGGNMQLKSSLVSGAYPILNKRTGNRWAGVGVSMMDDRAGGIFSTQEASLSYAFNIFLARFQTLSLGFKGLYQQRKLNLEGLYTGAQYIADRGFDRSIFNGEHIDFLRTEFLTFSSGLYWQQADKEGNKLAYWGVSLFDFNKPQDSFFGIDSQLSSTFILSGGLRIYENNQVAFMPEILFTRSASNNVLNIGAVTSYYLKSLPNQFTPHIDIITKYVTGRSGIVGLQLHNKNFSIGFSYDFPVIKRNVGNLNAFEVGMELRKLVNARAKLKTIAKRKTVPQQKPRQTKASEEREVVKKNPDESTRNQSKAKTPVKKQSDLKATLQHKQDSALASAEAGKIKHEPFVLEKVILHFNFEFNSAELDDNSTQYLDDLIAALSENPHLKISLIGHTDNVGSAQFNKRLSLYRADAIKAYLTEKGIEQQRIQTEGSGLAEPLNENKTEEDRAKNRRVELIILYED